MEKTTVRSLMVLILLALILVSDGHAGSSGPFYLTTGYTRAIYTVNCMILRTWHYKNVHLPIRV